MKSIIKEVYASVNIRVVHTSLVGFCVVLFAFLVPR